MLSIPSSILDVEEDEEEKIKAGTSLAISDAGTYAVSAREGLEIYPSCPDIASGPNHSHTESEEDVDTLVRFFHLENKLDPSQAPNADNNDAPPARLSLGDRVQIVCLEGGWAKLSRGYGFVRADGQKLVKGKYCASAYFERIITAEHRGQQFFSLPRGCSAPCGIVGKQPVKSTQQRFEQLLWMLGGVTLSPHRFLHS